MGDGYVFEFRRNRDDNVHSREGIWTLAKNLCLTSKDGLVFLEPTCSSFLPFVSVSTSKRADEIWQCYRKLCLNFYCLTFVLFGR